MCWRCDLVRHTSQLLSRQSTAPCSSRSLSRSVNRLPRPVARHLVSSTSQFHSSSLLLKKGGKAERAASASSSNATPDGDIFQLTSLRQAIQAITSRLTDDIAKLRSTTRVNADAVEGIRVTVDKSSKNTVPLKEVAQVVPKGGRSIIVQVLDTEVCVDICVFKIFCRKADWRNA
jgi:hypothetical protein